MAKEVIINAKINTGNSAKDVSDVLKEVKGLKEQTQETNTANQNFEERLKNLNKEVKSGGLGVRQLSRKIKEYQDIAIQAGADSPIGQQAISDASRLQDQLDSLNTRVKNLSDDGVALKSALAIGQGVVQGYQGFLGVQTLLGTENEKMLEVLTKLQGAQAVVNSLSAVRNALDKDQIATYKQLVTGLTANTVAQRAYALAVGTSTGAMKAFRLALIATGIGAIVVAIGMLIANFDKVTNVVNKAIDRFKNLGSGMKTFLSIAFPVIGVIRGIAFALEALGIIESDEDRAREKHAKKQIERLQKEREEREKNIKKLEEEHEQFRENAEFELRMLKAQGAGKKELFEAEQMLRKSIIENNVARGKELMNINALIIAERDLLFARGQTDEAYALNERVAENNKQIRELNKQNKKLLQDLKVADAQFKTDLEKEEEKHQAELRKVREKALEDRKKLEEQFLDFVRDVNFRLLDEETKFWQQSVDNRLNDLDQLQEYFDAKLLSEEQYLKQRDAINQFYDEQERERIEANRLREEEEERERQESLFAEIEAENERRLELEQQLRDEEIRIQKEKDDIIEQMRQFRVSQDQELYKQLISIGDLFQGESEEQQKRAFQINKAGAISDAVIKTIQSAQAAYASQIIPGDPTSPVRATIAAAKATAIGAANVAKIAKTPFRNARVPGMAVGGGMQPIGQSDFNQAQPIQLFGSANQMDEAMGSQNITVTAKVVETDMTDTQNEVANINELGEL